MSHSPRSIRWNNIDPSGVVIPAESAVRLRNSGKKAGDKEDRRNEYVDTVPGCVNRVRPVGGGRRLRGRGQRDERVHDGIRSRHVDHRMAQHVRSAHTPRLINNFHHSRHRRRFLRPFTASAASVTDRLSDFSSWSRSKFSFHYIGELHAEYRRRSRGISMDSVDVRRRRGE